MTDSDVPRPESHPPGFDEDSPYEGEDLSTYPAWWRRNIEEFRTFDMRPYRPPRFDDDTLVPAVIRTLENELDVDIQIRAIDPGEEDNWGVWVDEEYVSPVTHERLGEGYTRYDLTATEFRSLVESAIDSGTASESE